MPSSRQHDTEVCISRPQGSGTVWFCGPEAMESDVVLVCGSDPDEYWTLSTAVEEGDDASPDVLSTASPPERRVLRSCDLPERFSQRKRAISETVSPPIHAILRLAARVAGRQIQIQCLRYHRLLGDGFEAGADTPRHSSPFNDNTFAAIQLPGWLTLRRFFADPNGSQTAFKSLFGLPQFLPYSPTT